MADKSIGELVAATSVGAQDLFVVEQSGTAKKMTGQVFTNWLTSYADGHGGVQSIAKTSASGLVDTYTITYADLSTTTFTVTNGKAISSITQYFAVSASNSTVPSSWVTTRPTMTTTNKYLWSYFSFAFNDSTVTDTTKTVIGVYGDTGAQTYVWIKYSAEQPTSNNDMGNTPDNWIGIYVGTSSTPPVAYTSYDWYEYKGEKGDTGAAATLSSATIGYQQSDDGAVAPSGTWNTSVPTPSAGKYLWTRVIITFNSGSPITFYSVARYGIDGSGAVAAVNSVPPDENGNVTLNASMIGTQDSTSIQEHLDNLEDVVETFQKKLVKLTVSITAATTSQQIGSVTSSGINSDMAVLHYEIANPTYQTSDWTVTTYDSAPQLRVVGTASASTTLTVILGEA